MNPRSSIRTSLLLAFGLCLGIVSLVQLATRYFIELPELYVLEQRNDIEAANQVRRAIANEIELKRALAIDNAHWLDAYEFIQLDPSGERFAEFAEREYTHYESMHVLPRVSGYTYFSDDGERFFESNYDLLNQRDGESLPLAVGDLPPLPDASYDATDGGFIQTSTGPILYVVTGITDDEATLEPVGHLVIWRKLDALFLEELFAPLGIGYEFMSVTGQDDLIKNINAAPAAVLPRDKKGFIHWLVNDINEDPLLIIRQVTPPRSFQDGLLSTSSIVGITASALLLLVLGAQLSRNLVQPLEKLRAFVEEVVVTEDFSQRLNSERRDEVGVIARRFDQLLERVERQEDELKSQNAELEQLAEIDSLTGLGNRRVFDRMLLQGWSVAARVQHPISCVMLDVDCFKSYNDHCGRSGTAGGSGRARE